MQKVNIENLDEADYYVNEAYKTLRTNLLFCGDDIKVIMFTSCTANEGKSTVVMNLASHLTANGKKVVVLDADLRKSVLVGRHHATFDSELKGMTHYLSGQCKMEEALYETNKDNLHIMFAGPVSPNTTELLGNESFSKMVEKLRGEYDYIIIDAPPLGAVIDAAIITRVIDGAILLVESNHVSYKFAQNVKKQLESTGTRILGCILNKISMNQGGYYKGYYKKYYGGKYYGHKYYGHKYYGHKEYYGQEQEDEE